MAIDRANMLVREEGNYLSDVLLMELEQYYCRSSATLSQDEAAEEDLYIGQVLQANSSQYVPCTVGSSAAAILLERVSKASLIAGDVTVCVLIRGPAIVNSDKLVIAANQKSAALTALEAKGIVARTEALSVAQSV